MTVQVRTNEERKPLILDGGIGYRKGGQTITQDASRTADLVNGTVMAQKVADQEWVPFTDLTATDGSAIPRGIYLGPDIAFATLVAGDVDNAVILVGGSVKFDQDLITLENSLTLNSVLATGTIHSRRVEDALAELGLFAGEGEDISSFENS